MTDSKSVGQGWKLVPIEPTKEMTAAGSYEVSALTHFGAQCCYKAMLARAPEPPPSPIDPEVHRQVVEALRIAEGLLDDASVNYISKDDRLAKMNAARLVIREARNVQVGLPPYPKGEVTGPCICGSWPGGECLRCPVARAALSLAGEVR